MSSWIMPAVGLFVLVFGTFQVLSGFGAKGNGAVAPNDLSAREEPSLHHDYTVQAETLFKRFAQRHGLRYQVEDARMEVCWTFPEQPGLSMPITLGLQNCDELNFGVSDFWSYFFPFESVVERFENAIDAWVMGDARIAVTGFRGRLLQVREGTRWRSIYGANGCLFPFRWAPFRYEMNRSDSLTSSCS